MIALPGPTSTPVVIANYICNETGQVCPKTSGVAAMCDYIFTKCRSISSSWFKSEMVSAAAVDVRALAALRIGAALVLLWDHAFRSLDLTAHYTDFGVLTREARMAYEWDFGCPWYLSLYMLSGSTWWAATLFIVAAIAAVCLLVGYRTKPALLVSWFLLYSLHGRFPLLTQGGDILLRCLLFWMLFLPLDKRWSWRRETWQPTTESTSVVSWGTAAVLAQLCFMYVFSALLKTGPSWTSNFNATYYALHIDHYTSPLGYSVLALPAWVLQAVTFATMVLELVAPLILFVPGLSRGARWIVPTLFILFHAGLAACLDLGTFPIICILYWLALYPTPFWDTLERTWTRPVRASNLDTPTLHLSPAWNAAVGLLLIYVFALNIVRLREPTARVGAGIVARVGEACGLEQYWNMFAPGPYEFGGWIRLEGELADGTLVNVYHPHEPLANEKPAYVSRTYSTRYWRRCLVTAYEFGDPGQQAGILRYFAQQWNEGHPQNPVIRARYVHMVQPTNPPGSQVAQGEVEPKVLREIEINPSARLACPTPPPQNVSHLRHE